MDRIYTHTKKRIANVRLDFFNKIKNVPLYQYAIANSLLILFAKFLEKNIVSRYAPVRPS